MTIKEAADEIKKQWRQVLPMIGLHPAQEKVNGETSYICPICGHGSHGDGLTYNKNSRSGTGLKCFGCGFSGSDLDLYAEMKGVDLSDAAQYVECVKDLAPFLGLDIDDQQADLPPGSFKNKPASVTFNQKEAQPQTVEASITDPPQRKPNTLYRYKDKLEKAAADLFSDAGKDALDYLHSRGLTDAIIKKYKLGYSPSEYFVKAKQAGEEPNRPAIVFPHSAGFSYFTARSLQGKYFMKPTEAEAGSQPIYNRLALYDDMPCIICEAAADALSVIQSGGNAAALIGTAWESVLMPEIRKKKPTAPLVLCLDLDPPDAEGNPSKGQKAQEALAAALDAEDVPYTVAHFSLDKYQGKKDDPNSLLQDNPAQFEIDVAQITAEALRKLKPDNVKDYVLQIMPGEIERLRMDAGRLTGFSNLDAIIGNLNSGLIIAGGIASVGKTSFFYQLGDQLAEAGQHVLFISLEMSRLELVSKSISRRTKMLTGDKGGAVTSLQIRLGAKGEIVSRATQEYLKAVDDRLSIIEGDFDCDADKIRSYALQYAEYNKTVPIIILDYLQVLQPITDAKGRKATDPRIITNENITALKRLSRELQTPVIVVSSLNRGNYTAPLDFESFRESGGIEYGADMLLGLQLECMNEDLFQKDKGLVEKRQRIKEAKAEMPRKIELVCLKNRYGKSNFSCMFDYLPQYDYFLPHDADFKQVQEGDAVPFDYAQMDIF